MILATSARYPSYKNLEVAWLAELPVHWHLRRLKTLLLSSLQYGANEAADFDNRSEPRFIRITDIDDSGALRDETFRSLPRHLAHPYLLNDNDILLARSGATVGKSFIYSAKSGEACFAGYLIRARLQTSQCDPKFVYYFCQTAEYWSYIGEAQIQATIQNVSAEKYANLELPLPPSEEQTQIVVFLDYETARIDALIEKQEQLIRLLKEKRQAVISHAVTKGLNPDAPMRDSGVEWLGEVPAHWGLKRIKHLVTGIIDGPHFSPKYTDEGYMFISARNIKVNHWSLSDAKFVSEEDFHEFNKRVRPEIGDVLLTKGGTTGIARAVDLEFPFQVWVHVAVLKTIHSRIDPFFLAYALNGTACYEQSQIYTRGATNKDLGLGRIANIRLVVPSLTEQTTITSFLNKRCLALDDLVASAEQSSLLLRERRTALISAAVTGKIDVRNWQPPTQAKAEVA